VTLSPSIEERVRIERRMGSVEIDGTTADSQAPTAAGGSTQRRLPLGMSGEARPGALCEPAGRIFSRGSVSLEALEPEAPDAAIPRRRPEAERQGNCL